MVKRLLLPLLAALIIAAMVVPGCGDPATTFALTMAVNDSDMGSAVDLTAGSPYAEGASVSIEATANTGYKFVNWTAPAGTFANDESRTTTFTMPGQAVTVTANFEELPPDTYNVLFTTSPSGGGTAKDTAGIGFYEAGETVEILGSPKWGYFNFDVWSSEQVTVAKADSAKTTFVMPAEAVTLNAAFVAQEVTGPYYTFLADLYASLELGNPGSFEAEMLERFTNLKSFGADRGHLWVGAGPMYVHSVAPVLKSITLRKFDAYPDDGNRFLHLIDKSAADGVNQGAWVDEVIITREPVEATGVAKLIDGAIDVFAHGISRADLLALVEDDAGVWRKDSFGSFNTLRVNPYGPEFDGNKLNPFHFAEVREAFQYLIDREYICDDLMGGMATPRYLPLGPWGDYDRYKDMITPIEEMYGYDADKMGDFRDLVVGLTPDVPGTVTFDGGQLKYNGTQIEVKVAIRSDDPQRTTIGNYIVSQLNAIGFKGTAVPGDMATILSPVVNNTAKIKDGSWTFYTGGWVSTVISRDCGYWFAYFYSDLWKTGIPAFEYLPKIDWGTEGADPPDWGSLDPAWDAFYAAALDLLYLEFETMDERKDLFEIALPGSMEMSSMIMLTNNINFGPLSVDVDLAADMSGGIYGSWMWAYTIHTCDGRGEAPIAPDGNTSVRVALFDLLVEPWNPVAGSNTVYDMFPIRATGDMAHHPDTNIGIRHPGRIEKAEVYVPTGIPVGQDEASEDWLELFQLAPGNRDALVAPATAWSSWDAANQKVITAGERFATIPTASRLSVAYYPEGTFGHPLHDGSEVSFADFLMYWILLYDRGMPESGIYDPARVVGLNSLLADVIGVEFILDDPDYDLIVKTWSTIWEMDAERMVSGWWPNYAQGNGFWHVLYLAALAEADGFMAFGEVKAGNEGVFWTNFLMGESLPVLGTYLDNMILELSS